MTSSSNPINFTFEAQAQENTTLFINSTRTNISIQPFSPLLLRFKFDANTTNAKLIVSSEDSRCMIISADYTMCPTIKTFDRNIKFGGSTKRIQKGGVLYLKKCQNQNRKSKCQDGELFIILETQPLNDICEHNYTHTSTSDLIFHSFEKDANLTKTISITVRSAEITKFDWYINLMIGLIVPFIVTVIIFVPSLSSQLCISSVKRCFTSILRRGVGYTRMSTSLEANQNIVNSATIPLTGFEKKCYKSTDNRDENAPATPQKQKQLPNHNSPSFAQLSDPNYYQSSYSFAFNNSINVLWALALQTSWYLLPAYQFVALSRNEINMLDEDSQYCYYDNICAKPYTFESLQIQVPSFHNILSNLPYMSLGFFSMVLAFVRKFKRKQKTAILMSLGASLMIEGIFSAMYHVCPSTYNFQFDTTFMYTMLLLHISILLYLNSPSSPTPTEKTDASLSNGVRSPQVSKTQKRSQFSQWIIFAAITLLGWLVALKRNFEKKVHALLFFVLTFVAFVYLLVQLICIIIYTLEYYSSSAGANGEPGSDSTNTKDGVCKTVASKDTNPFYFNTNKLTWQNIKRIITYRTISLVLIISLIIICILYSIGIGIGTTVGLIGVFKNNTGTDIEKVDNGVDVNVRLIHLAAIISFSYYLYEANIEIGNRSNPNVQNSEKTRKIKLIVILLLSNIGYTILPLIISIKRLNSLTNYFLFALGMNWFILYMYTMFKKCFLYCNSRSCFRKCFFCNIWWFYVNIIQILGLFLMFVAGYFFVNTSYNTNTTPLKSLNMNTGCWSILWIEKVYDAHDWWHVFSAFSVYFISISMLFFNEDLDSIEQAKRELETPQTLLSVHISLEPSKYSQFSIPKREGNLLDIHEDPDARQLLQFCYPHFNNWKPIKIEADGNCLFNVFAMFLLGKHDTEMSKILRVYSTFELISNIDVYKRDERCRGYLRHPDGREADDHEIETEIIKEAKCCAQFGKWCGYITLIAIANILRRPIRLVHPINSNNIKLAHDPNVMNQTINPTVTEPAAETIYLLACGNVDGLKRGEEWRPSHFVLLIDTNSPADV